MGLNYPCTFPKVLTEEMLMALAHVFPYLTEETKKAIYRDLASHGTVSSMTSTAASSTDRCARLSTNDSTQEPE